MFPIFGAAAPQTSALPLAFILVITAIKDGVEDYRRAILDNEVNNSAVTVLGQWRNVNLASDRRSWFQRVFRLSPPGTMSKGVRKLREKEAGEAGAGMRIVLNKGGEGDQVSMSTPNDSTADLGRGGRRLEPIHSIDERHTYPPQADSEANTIISPSGTNSNQWSGGSGSLTAYQQSLHTRSASGVVDYGKRSTGMAQWERTLWKKLEVGDVVLLRENEQVPADLMVISTSDPDDLCYLETKNLDGETNLKPRRAVRSTASVTSELDLERASFVLDSEPPHQNLYLYQGVLRYTDSSTGEQKQDSVTINEFLLRGCTLRNTSWVIGLVVFTGADTKIMLNGGDTPSKQSKIEKETNFNVAVNFIVLFAMCLVSALANGIFDTKGSTSAKFYELGGDPTHSAVVNALVTFV